MEFIQQSQERLGKIKEKLETAGKERMEAARKETQGGGGVGKRKGLKTTRKTVSFKKTPLSSVGSPGAKPTAAGDAAFSGELDEDRGKVQDTKPGPSGFRGSYSYYHGGSMVLIGI